MRITKKTLLLLTIFFFVTSEAFAKWKYSPGDVVENEVIFGSKDRFLLPPGKFFVGLVERENEFKDLMLYQIDKESGYVRWAIHFYATGNTQWEWWNQPDFCKRTNVYFIKKAKGNKSYACWMINHYRSDIPANKGFWAKVREYEISNNLKNPDIYVGSRHEYSKGSKLWGSSYYYNPELDGVPKPKNIEWATNEFHMQRVQDYPKHEAFLKKYISVASNFINAFNNTHKIKNSSKLSLQASQYFSNENINVESNLVKKNSNDQKKDIVNEIKQLKELMDTGVITKEEFDQAKKRLLN